MYFCGADGDGDIHCCCSSCAGGISVKRIPEDGICTGKKCTYINAYDDIVAPIQVHALFAGLAVHK